MIVRVVYSLIEEVILRFEMYVKLIQDCFKVGIVFFGLWSLCFDVIFKVIPLGVIIVLLFFIIVRFLRVPTPATGQIEAIIGKDPALEDTINENGIIKTIAHRGAGLDAPENSLIAFKMCNDKGVNFIEFDITLTKDNVPVLFHDNTLERMTDCSDLISNKTYDELKQLDISVKHSFKDRYKGTTIPTLDETVKQLLDSEQNMFIDIKDNNMQVCIRSKQCFILILKC
ncbi:glycerophosphodiester phosphodiesterase 1 [Holotrichia oblita]|uniref:Glycerophosphodiester phosphodiesterase 1 n=1 Tax=Holotrichia oblita TaxID=644536 RepID=A0ACB9SRZ4_HOLOL|nr:glycerophosphodiester phosphodiesterase 1 [Holotrichia oblita]